MESFAEIIRSSVAEDQSSASPGFAEIGPGIDQQTAFGRLAAATLQAAIRDALGPDSQPAFSAIRWLARDTSEGITMEMCCTLLGLDPEGALPLLILDSEILVGRLSRYRKIVAYAHARS